MPPKKKGKAPPSAVAKLAQKRVEEVKKQEEAMRLAEEEEKQKQEEFERKQREEEEKKQFLLEERKRRKAEKIAKQKEEGTFMTKAEREKKNKREQARKLLEQSGLICGSRDGGESTQKNFFESFRKKKKFIPPPKPVVEEEIVKEEEEDEEIKEPEVVEKVKDDGWVLLSSEEEAEEEEEEEEEEVEEAEKVEEKKEEDVIRKKKKREIDYTLRSPIVCILGHVDTGKTKLLDKFRRTNVQEGEAGGITQQIGATFFPHEAVVTEIAKLTDDFECKIPGLLVIDTPGHESFSNLRSRGSSICDLAILVVDIMHGLEQQTIESIQILKKMRCPFVIALNKIDRIYGWETEREYESSRFSLEKQSTRVFREFEKLRDQILVQFAEQDLNTVLYWENQNILKNLNIVPTSAMTGSGIPDLLYTIMNLCQSPGLAPKIELKLDSITCTVLEVKEETGLGITIDVILTQGILREGDNIVVSTTHGPELTQIRALLTPHPMVEMRIKSEYIHHKELRAACGIKLVAQHLEGTVPGTSILKYDSHKDNPAKDHLNELKEFAKEELEKTLNAFPKKSEGVYVMASTIGSLEALLAFLQSQSIPVFDMNIGDVHKMDVRKAALMRQKKCPQYAAILAFDNKIDNDAKKQAETEGVRIFSAKIMYHLEDQFVEYLNEFTQKKKDEHVGKAQFPVQLAVIPNFIFNKRDPIIIGCDVQAGKLRVGTHLCTFVENQLVVVGRCMSIEKDKKQVKEGKKGEQVCIRIGSLPQNVNCTFGRHFNETHTLYSLITRESIDCLKEFFRDEMTKEDWRTVVSLKKIFKIL